ncbi:MAG: hypothetical protein U9R69_01420 [Thermodesulfobacteriota bacterium]|nr:hypothetical protein [Thermodesulfobacteriota bacterium]
MKNGYALPSKSGLEEISKRLKDSSESEVDRLRSSLRIGIQWNTQVTLNGASHRVSQAYCSALPVAYSNHPSSLWMDFAKLILEASYGATICAAIVNSEKTGNNKVFFTLLGGGVFGHETDWISGAILRALILYKNANLDVTIVSYESSKPCVQQLINEYLRR